MHAYKIACINSTCIEELLQFRKAVGSYLNQRRSLQGKEKWHMHLRPSTASFKEEQTPPLLMN